MINQETIQHIKDSIRIEELIGEFVQLRRRGANFIGCCPFHNEKTPSFNVSPARGIFKCFGCGESGDAVSFLMKYEHYSYPEALRWLAKKYNIPIEVEELTDEQKERNNERDALFHLSEFAQKYFANILFNDELGRSIGLSYFHSRGLSDKVIKSFGLGYSLDSYSAFTSYARSQGYSDRVLNNTGLSIFKDDGSAYDRFRGRVIFPIYSVSGRVLGFSGRILSKEKQAAKYVNSPDSEIYNKSHILYGLFQARTAIARADKCYLVEGNIDVISMFQSGVENTVASCGTSLTVEQARLIHRYTHNITVLYDGDQAGIKAAFRAVNILFEEGFHVRLVLFPSGEDPDSYAQSHGSEALQTYLKENETNFILFKTKVLMNEIQGDPIRKVEVLKEIIHTISLVPDMMERTEYISQCASLLHMPEQTLHSELAKELNRRAMKSSARPTSSDTPSPSPLESSIQQPVLPQNTPLQNPDSLNPSPANELVINPAEEQERKLISLLLNDANTLISSSMLSNFRKDNDLQTQNTPEVFSLAQIVVGDVLNDNLSFSDPSLLAIFNYFADNISSDSDKYFDVTELLHHHDPKVRDTVSSLLIQQYEPSVNWEAKKNIFIPSHSDQLVHDLFESLISFKLKKIDLKIQTIDNQFESLTTDEDKLLLMQEKMRYIRVRQKLGSQLKRVIT